MVSPVFLIVDDHDAVQQCVRSLLQTAYPEATLLSARDCETARVQVAQYQPTLVLMDIHLPQVTGEMSCYAAGIDLLQSIMVRENKPNILVLGTSVRPLVRVSSDIDYYPSGFTTLDKSEPISKIVKMVDLALRGSIYLPTTVRWRRGAADDVRSDFKPQWLTLLALKFHQGLSDRAIAQNMGISTRTVRSYWQHIQDSLEVYDDPEKDIRVQIECAARRTGLID